MTGTISERFESKVDRSPGQGPDGDCHLWTACRHRQGYGKIAAGGRGGKVLKAHRVAWELAFGAIPDGLCVLHKCDSPPCCRVDHLFLGTQLENIADRDAKGRGNGPKGSDVSQAKLTEVEIPVIRRLLAQGVSQEEIGSRFGVLAGTISHINTGRTWTHVSAEGYA
jgi:hypothetical protein